MWKQEPVLHFGGPGGKSTSKSTEKQKDFQTRNFRHKDTNGVFGRDSCVLAERLTGLKAGTCDKKGTLIAYIKLSEF